MQRFNAVLSRRRLLALLAVSLAALAGAGTANAASFTVTTTADSSDGTCTATLCSLRDAVEAADAAGGSSTITVPAGTYTLTIEPTGTAFDPTQGDLDIINDAKVTIKGAGQASTIVDANEIDRAFTVDDGAGLSLSDLTIANGRSGTDTGGECGTCGGGVWSQGALALSNVTVTASDGGTAGGAIFSGDDAGSTLSVTDSTFTFDNADLGGALATGPSASTTISGSTFSSNVGFEQGGALQNEEGSLSIDSSTFSDNVSGQSGGAIEELTDSPLTVTNSSFTDNSTTSVSGAIDDIDSSALTLTDSRFVGNSAASDGVLDVLAAGGTVTLNGDELDHNSGGAVGVDQVDSLTATDTSFIGNHGGFGAALFIDAGTLSLTNVTMSQNSSPTFGGALEFGTPTPTSLTNVTIADNSAAPGEGGGVVDGSFMTTGSGATGVRNTIIADNTGGDCADRFSSSGRVPAAVDAGFNLDSDGSCLKGDASSDKVGVNPLLEPPADNGGSVLTDALQPGSPAIDAGTDTGCPASDARGVSRPQGASCDMGAFEFAAAQLALGASAPANAATGAPITYTLKTTDNGPGPSTATTVVDQLPASATLFGATASQGSCSSSGAPAKVTCSLGMLAKGETATDDDRRRRVPGRDRHQHSDGDERRGLGYGRLGGHGGQRAGGARGCWRAKGDHGGRQRDRQARRHPEWAHQQRRTADCVLLRVRQDEFAGEHHHGASRAVQRERRGHGVAPVARDGLPLPARGGQRQRQLEGLGPQVQDDRAGRRAAARRHQARSQRPHGDGDVHVREQEGVQRLGDDHRPAGLEEGRAREGQSGTDPRRQAALGVPLGALGRAGPAREGPEAAPCGQAERPGGQRSARPRPRRDRDAGIARWPAPGHW